MRKLVYKIGTGVATAVLLASGLTPAVFADNEVTIDHNGAGSTNTAISASIDFRRCRQANRARVRNRKLQVSNTGLNDASGNTGGNTTVDTGNATTTSTNTTSGNSNSCSI